MPRSGKDKQSAGASFVIPLEGFIDAVLDAAYRRKIDDLKKVLKNRTLSLEEDTGIKALVVLGKLPKEPKTKPMKSALAQTICSDYGCTRA